VAKPDELIGIGGFARRVRLSVKQLRSYDDLGLLAPAYVDPDSGYRYYHRGQARTAITIALLRSLDVPLADVHELLVADEPRSAALLERQRQRIEHELERVPRRCDRSSG
jgi:DNA-binding transcriptional MerR regulator